MPSDVSTDDDTLVDTVDAPRGFSSLPLDVVSTHVLRFLHEPADLGRLRAVSRGMRDAVDATRRKIKKLSDQKAADLGYVGLLKDRRSRGVLRDEYLLCAAAARSGQLEELKALRADNFPWNRPSTCATAARPWDASTCACAALGGHLEVLQWARENDCRWDEKTCACAALGGHLEVLKWARENGCPWTERAREIAAELGYVET